MTDFDAHRPDESLERYLDGMLNDEELIEFEKQLQSDERLRLKVEQHQAFNEHLRKSVVPTQPTVKSLESLLIERKTSVTKDSLSPSATLDQKFRRRLLVGTFSVLAAVAAAWLIATSLNGGKKVTPFFEQRPLAMIYAETVEQGFRPYYVCEDQERFARTFRRRQKIALELQETPADRRMVGLSYIGGLSRDTTAMLAYADDKPIVVFVDRKNFDNEPLLSQRNEKLANLHVHRSELADLVVYEISPFDSVKLTPYLQVAVD